MIPAPGYFFVPMPAPRKTQGLSTRARSFLAPSLEMTATSFTTGLFTSVLFLV